MIRRVRQAAPGAKLLSTIAGLFGRCGQSETLAHVSSLELVAHHTRGTVVHQLHWLHVWQRVEYKVACLVIPVIIWQAPAYIG